MIRPTARLRRETEGHAQTPSEVLIREDRDAGHRVTPGQALKRLVKPDGRAAAPPAAGDVGPDAGDVR